jgi:glycosyltransferase involved in cell wall biosynthesis
MAEAFQRVLGPGFVLSAPTGNESFSAPYWKPLRCYFSRRMPRYLEYTLRLLLGRSWRQHEAVFTRDIGVAWVLASLGRRVGYEIHTDFFGPLARALLRRSPNTLQFVAISDALRRRLAQKYGIQENRILVAHDGVDLWRFERARTRGKSALRRELALPEGGTLIVHSGSMSPGRGVELMRILLERYPDITGVLAGGKDADIARIKEYFGGLNNVMFLGHQPQDIVARLQAAGDLLFFPMNKGNPIWWCSSPLKLFEYMASGTPIIGSAIGGAAEVLDGGAAYLFDAERPESLVAAFEEWKQDRDHGAARAQRALELVQNYTWDARAKRIAAFLTR